MAAHETEIKSSTSIVPVLFVELVLMAGTVILSYHFEYTDTFPVHTQGFFCYDSTLSKPYPVQRAQAGLPHVCCIRSSLFLPIIMILLGEVISVLTHPHWKSREKVIACGDCCFFNLYCDVCGKDPWSLLFGLFCTVIFAGAVQTSPATRPLTSCLCVALTTRLWGVCHTFNMCQPRTPARGTPSLSPKLEKLSHQNLQLWEHIPLCTP
ncbi:hypothetical protein GDO86_006948 [Hymenochirus boettgeri]|uniref:Uncharacterized protein n=1 Tax=Hymenochirus boettgeri TaxID=247094 RepID=A0A8T2JDM7_9PIPI|nr:hypothetical protein GDO86_006948 [Hymenochirus boettgeri]